MGRPIKKGSTDQSTTIRIIDSSDGTPETGVEYDTSGIDLWYRREQETKTSITEAALAALDSAHSDGGIEHIGDGYYRLDLPDAAVAAGSGENSVQIGGTVTGMIVIGNEHALYDVDPYDTVRMGLTALPNAAADAAGGLPISDAGGLDLDNQIGTDIDAILADTNELQSDDVPGLISALDTVVDRVETDTQDIQSRIPAALVSGRMSSDAVAISGSTTAADNVEANISNLDHSVATVDGNVDTLLTRITAAIATKAEMDTAHGLLATEAKQDTMDTVVDGIQTDLNNGTDGLGALKTLIDALPSTADVNAQCDASIETYKLDHLIAVADADDPVDNSIIAKMAASDGDWSGFDNSTDSLEAVRDRGDADWSSGAAANPNMLLEAEVATVNTQTSFTLASGSDEDDAYNDQAIVLYDDSNSDYPSVRVISDYTGSTKTVTIDSGADFTLGTDDSVKIFVTAPGTSAPTAAQVRAEIDSNSTQLAAIVADTNELQTDDIPGTLSTMEGKIDTIDGIADNILVDTAVIGTLGAGLTGIPWNSAWDAEVQSECTDALNAYDPPTKTEMDTAHGLLATEAKQDIIDTNVDSVLVDTGTTLPATLSTIEGKIDTVDGIVDDILVDTGTTLPAEHAALPTAAEIQAEMEENGASILDTIRDDLADGGRLDLLIDAIKAKTDLQPSGIPKNIALSDLMVLMIDSTDDISPKTGLTPAVTISKDGAAFGAATNTPATEVSNGYYKIDLTQAEMNADMIVVRLANAGANDTSVVIKTDT